MNRLFSTLLLTVCFTFLIVVSYGKWNQNSQITKDKAEDYINDYDIRDSILDQESKSTSDNRRSVWISYLEINSYLQSVDHNNEENFRTFFAHIIKRSKSCHINNLIVQVRPFSDALYPSKYFPWSKYISGKQGKNPGYDPLKIMIEMAHKEKMTIEAWINPYRICSKDDYKKLAEDHPAKKWASKEKSKKNVLFYDGTYYFNPSSKNVRHLIVLGVKEIVENYSVDGIHMDDYFYPSFTKENVSTAFDSEQYKAGLADGSISSNTDIASWRRENVNLLVRSLHLTIKKVNPDISFGISPQGNLANLRSNYQNYVDIDRWLKSSDYVDYIMPQIYWGFQHDTTPFDKMIKKWSKLTKTSKVSLRIGIQLYRMASVDQRLPDYKELQNPGLIKEEITYLRKLGIEDYGLFSYQYIDSDCSDYHFAATEYSEERKNILIQMTKMLQ